MIAMWLDEAGGRHELIAREMAMPSPGKGEVLVKVRAAGVTPSEMEWYPTTHAKDGSARTHAVPGHEFSGIVQAVGAEVTGFAPGDEIYGMSDWFADGATAEYCLAAAASIARKPVRISHAEAAAVPIGALTVWQGLIDRAKLQKGEHVLIHGGAGAVGIFAIQLARELGAQITVTASARHREFLTSLGADRVIDCRNERFEELVRDVDVVFDGVGGDTLIRSWEVLKPKGRVVTIAASSEYLADDRTKAAFFIVEPNQQQLIEVGARLDRGDWRVFVDAEVPLEQASAAYFGKVERKHGYGKVIVTVA